MGLLAEEAEQLGVTAQKVTDALAAAAFGCVSDVFASNGSITSPAALPRAIGLAVKRIKRRGIHGPTDANGNRPVVGHIVEVEVCDRVQPLHLLGLGLGLFAERTEHSANDALLLALQEGGRRALTQS